MMPMISHILNDWKLPAMMIRPVWVSSIEGLGSFAGKARYRFRVTLDEEASPTAGRRFTRA